MGAKWRAQVLYLPVAHYKVEAGADARYLSDLIHRMTGASAYLDSSDLVDLGTLFREGVHKTDVMVSPSNYSTRALWPWPWL